MKKELLFGHYAEKAALIFKDGKHQTQPMKLSSSMGSEIGKYAGILGIRMPRKKRSHIRKRKTKKYASFKMAIKNKLYTKN